MVASASSPRLCRPISAVAVATASSALPGAGPDGCSCRRPGKGIIKAAPKITTMTAIRARLASETVKIDQCRYRPGPFRLPNVANDEAVIMLAFLLEMLAGNGTTRRSTDHSAPAACPGE